MYDQQHVAAVLAVVVVVVVVVVDVVVVVYAFPSGLVCPVDALVLRLFW